MSSKKNQPSQNSTETIEGAFDLYRQTIDGTSDLYRRAIRLYPEELLLWTLREPKNPLKILRDIIVLGVPGFIVSTLIEFWQWRESFLNNLTFAGAIRYINQFSKGE